MGESDAEGEVGAEGFAAAKHFVIAGTEFVADFDVQGFGDAAGFFLPLGFEGERATAFGEAMEEAVGVVFQFGEGLVDDHGGDAVAAEGGFEDGIDFLIPAKLGELLVRLLHFLAAVLEVGEAFLKSAEFVLDLVSLFFLALALGFVGLEMGFLLFEFVEFGLGLFDFLFEFVLAFSVMLALLAARLEFFANVRKAFGGVLELLPFGEGVAELILFLLEGFSLLQLFFQRGDLLVEGIALFLFRESELMFIQFLLHAVDCILQSGDLLLGGVAAL